MVCRYDGRRLRMIVLVALVALGFALPVAAQNVVVGKVTDVKGALVEGATIIVSQPDTGRKYETKTGKDGTYAQLGLTTGTYLITAKKEGVGAAVSEVSVRGGKVTANFVIALTAGENLSKAFNEGVAANAAGNFDAAIAKFNEALKASPQCSECYYNIGVTNLSKKDYDKAEEAYKKSIEIKPSAEAYNGLVNVYTAQRKVDQAQEAAKMAAELTVTAGGVTTDRIVGDPAMRDEARAVMDEAIAAGNADLAAHGEGARLDRDEVVARMFRATDAMGAYRPSTMIDFVEGRPMEVDAMFGEPLRRAQALGVATPRLSLLTAQIRALDARSRANERS